jgi:threonine/homoserine/homoserine lactone efflux protein
VGNPLLFVGSVLLLLIVPGPTNTLLGTSGATVGFRRSLPLLLGELFGYMISIVVIQAALHPAMSRTPTIALLMRVAAGLYLLLLAFRLWTATLMVTRAMISVRQVFVTTLLNPKAFAFAVLIVNLGTGNFPLYLGFIAAMVPVIGMLWITAGHALGRATEPAYLKIIPKAASLILATFSAILVGSAVVAAPH